MEDKYYEKSQNYLQSEFKTGGDYYIGLYLTQDQFDAKNEKRDSVLDWLSKNDPNLYKKIFSTIFIRENGGFEFASELIPHLDLKMLLNHIQQVMRDARGNSRQRLLDLYLLYSQALYFFKLRTEFTNTEILCLDPAVFVSQLKFDNLRPEDIDRFRYIDKKFIRTTMRFSMKEGRGSSNVAEYLMSNARPKEFEDVFKKVYKTELMPLLSKKHSRGVLLLSFVTLIEQSLLENNYSRAEAVIETIVNDFKDEVVIAQYYLQMKVLNNKFRDVMEYLRKEYTDDEIDKDPYLKMNLGIAKISEGDVPGGTVLLKEAYLQSGKDSEYLVNYSNALFIMDPKEAMNVLRNHLEKSDTPLEESHILSLTHKVFVVDIEFSKYLLDYCDKTYQRGDQERDEYGHYSYLLLLSQYYFYKKDYPRHASVLEDIAKRFPDLPGGYGKLAEFYSDRNIKEYLDLKKAIHYAKKNAEVEGVAPEYFIGICYANAGKSRKCIETLEKFVRDNKVTLQYINALLEISLGYFALGEGDEGCSWAAKWFDRYNSPEKKLLYAGFQIEREAQIQKDLEFLKFASRKCRKLGKRIEPVLESVELWVTSSMFSIELSREKMENEKLRKEVEKLEEELQTIKEKYRKLDLSVGENLEALFNEIEKNEKAHIALLKRMKRNIWQKSKEYIEELFPKLSKLPRDVQSFIHTSEFLLLANHEQSDFSGVILGYSKAFEVILDNQIGKPFIAKTGSTRDRVEGITDPRVKKLFPWKQYRRQSMGVGQWNAIISKYEKYPVESEDEVTQDFIRYVTALGKESVESIRNYSKKLAPSRSGSVHERKVIREDALEIVEEFRKAISDLCQIFY